MGGVFITGLGIRILGSENKESCVRGSVGLPGCSKCVDRM